MNKEETLVNEVPKHYKFYTEHGLWGAAVKYSRIDDEGRMWIGNTEYESQVNCCPMTGRPAPVQLKVVNVWEDDGTDEWGSNIIKTKVSITEPCRCDLSQIQCPNLPNCRLPF